MPIDASGSERLRAQGYVTRVYRLRMLSLLLGSIMVATVLARDGASAPVWILLVAHVLVWPHVAWLVARRRPKPVRAEKLWNITIDAAMVGVWMALMRFNLLPCITLVMPLGMVLISNGGLVAMTRGFSVMATSCAIVVILVDTPFEPGTSMPEIIASLPTLVVVPWLTSAMMYGLERQVRDQNRVLFRLGSVDSLSNLLNRRHWDDAAFQCLETHRRGNARSAMLLIDIDHFKQVNDRHGHTVGDEVITAIGGIIRANLREGDIAGRYGGDELGVLLVDADERSAALVAERIRASVAGSQFENAPGLRCTVSIGIAMSDAATSGVLRDWVKHADTALYRAKADGRNRTAGAA